MVKAIINSEKHYVQVGFNNVPMGSVRQSLIADARQDPSSANHVRVGSIIKAVYVEMWVIGNSPNQEGTQITTLEKIVGAGDPPDVADMIQLHDYPNKKNILYTTQGLTPDNASNPTPIMRGWYKIPKGKQRFGQGDSISLFQASQVDDYNICGLFVFKEYF